LIRSTDLTIIQLKDSNLYSSIPTGTCVWITRQSSRSPFAADFLYIDLVICWIDWGFVRVFKDWSRKWLPSNSHWTGRWMEDGIQDSEGIIWVANQVVLSKNWEISWCDESMILDRDSKFLTTFGLYHDKDLIYH